MKKALILILFIVAEILMFSFHPSFAGNEEIKFISSDNELNEVLAHKELINGLALSMDYYQQTGKNNQKKIKNLVSVVYVSGKRPVFFYGNSVDTKLISSWIKEKTTSCKSPMAVCFYLANILGGDVKFRYNSCVELNGDLSDKIFRGVVRQIWERMKEEISKNWQDLIDS